MLWFMWLMSLFLLLNDVYGAPQRTYEEPPAPYDFQYRVDNPPTNTLFGQNEAGDPTGRVSGSYFVYLPDGRLMTVDYTVDDQTGFLPTIRFQQNATPFGG